MHKMSKQPTKLAIIASAVMWALHAPHAMAQGAQVASSAAEQNQSVLVQVNEAYTLTFDGPVRLRQVLEQAVAQQGADIYWPNARLIDRAGTADLQQRQRELVAGLNLLRAYWLSRDNQTRADAVQGLAEQVAQWQLAYQPYLAIDLAAARQQLGANPLLAPGQYVLLTPERQDYVPVMGAMSPSRVRINPGYSVRQYMTQLVNTASSTPALNREHVTVVRPGGEFEQVPWGMHNARDSELTPGDILWVEPADSLFPRRFSALHQEIPELLRHWVGYGETLPPLDLNSRMAAVPYWQGFDTSPRRNHYGGVGLMQTPTARMADEGETVLMYADTDEYRRYTVSMQVLPWLQASAFYTRIPNRLYSNRPEFSGTNILTDKGFDVKLRLWQERQWLPEVSVGFQDFAGTGLFDGEYIVASKRYGAFDFTAGIGFGRNGSRDTVSNPFCDLADRFCDRSTQTVGTGSQLDFDRYFAGPAALFGGVEYQTPWEPLRLMLEYDGNDYSRDRAGVPIDASTPWNFGASYRVFDWLDASVSYERGDTLMFNVTLRTNLNTLSQVRVDRPRVEPQTPSAQSVDDVDWNRLAHSISNARTVSAPRFNMPDDTTVRVQGHAWRYRDNNEAIDRSARILANTLPESIETYEFEQLSAYMPVSLTRVDAEAFKRRIRNEDAGKRIDETAELFERESPAHDYEPTAWLYDYPRSNRIGYGLKPFFNQDFGSPETFHFYQLGVKAFASGWVARDLHLFGELGVNLKNNYDRFNFTRDPFDFDLPRVRSDFRLHATNDVWVDSLQATYYKRLSENVYGMAYGGYLERFFAGVGGEVLYRQIDSPWAFGVNINRVRQRNYEGWFGFEDYETTMGHASVYYQMPWLKDSLLRLDVGRFLAGDDGVGVTFSRRFDSGVTVLAYASFTNVSSEQYGEGSFTHGFSVSVPFDLIGIRPTRQRVSMSWSPMSRDGGQPLWRRIDLYGVTDERHPFWGR